MGGLLISILLAFILQSQNPQSADFQKAVSLQQQGKLEEAAAAYRALISRQPENAEAYANLGVVLGRLGKTDEAISAYEAALKANPSLIPVLLNAGILHFRTGNYERAVDELDRFLKVYPGHPQARQLLGLSLIEIGYNTAGIGQLEPVLAEGPPDPGVLYSLGLAYIRTNRLADAEGMIGKLKGLGQGEALSHLLRGQLLLFKFEFEAAVTELKQAQSINPGLPKLHYSLGLCYFKLALNKEALAEFREEFKQQPKDFTTIYYLATLLEAGDELEEARKFADQAYSMQSESVEVITLLGKVMSRQGRNEEAAKLIEQAVAKDPKDSVKHYLLGKIYRELGRREASNKEFNEARRLKAEETQTDREKGIKP